MSDPIPEPRSAGADARPSGAPGKMGATTLLYGVLDRLEKHGSENAGAPDAGEASLGDVLDRMDERAFGLILLLLALPCCLPFVYLLPQIVALPMLALTAQLALGKKHPWLPDRLKNRTFSIDAFRKVLKRSEKYLGWVEKIAQPRLSALTGPVGVRILGALLMVPTASILVPLPSTNTIPGIGVALAAVGLIERDGVLSAIGLLIGLIWVVILFFLGFEASQLIKDWVAARL